MNNTSMDLPQEGHMASVNGIQMYYELQGQGTPLVLLHNFTGCTQFWQPFVADFGKEYQLVIADLRDSGAPLQIQRRWPPFCGQSCLAIKMSCLKRRSRWRFCLLNHRIW